MGSSRWPCRGLGTVPGPSSKPLVLANVFCSEEKAGHAVKRWRGVRRSREYARRPSWKHPYQKLRILLADVCGSSRAWPFAPSAVGGARMHTIHIRKAPVVPRPEPERSLEAVTMTSPIVFPPGPPAGTADLSVAD